MRTTTSYVLLVSVSLALAVIIGCSDSYGPTLPSPDGGGGPANIIEVIDYIVAVGETVSFTENTIVRAENTVQIAGTVIGADGSAPGNDGVSIGIEAGGEVCITGTVQAGSGARGQDAPHANSSPGDSTAGGDGGSVSVSSSGSDITIGSTDSCDVDSAQANQAHLIAGDGADGGDSLTGSRGGDGGNVTLAAPQGTVTIPQTANAVHQGNGGRGGDGHVEGDDWELFDVPAEDIAAGGNGGALLVEANDFQGLQLQDGAYLAPDGVVTGGSGGDAGDLGLGCAPGADLLAESGLASSGPGEDIYPSPCSAPLQASDDVLWANPGSRGGAATWPGKPGDGRAASAQDGGLTLAFSGGRPLGAKGGRGGDLLFATITAVGFTRPVIDARNQAAYRGGNGGAADCAGAVGAAGANCANGGSGRAASAIGGKGGSVITTPIPGSWLAAMDIRGGEGGRAFAEAGLGGRGGDCCAGGGAPGGLGGNAGTYARATGGAGGDQVNVMGGFGASAWVAVATAAAEVMAARRVLPAVGPPRRSPPRVPAARATPKVHPGRWHEQSPGSPLAPAITATAVSRANSTMSSSPPTSAPPCLATGTGPAWKHARTLVLPQTSPWGARTTNRTRETARP